MIGRKCEDGLSFDVENKIKYIYIEDKAVSSKHCNIEILAGEDKAIITDESRNGTLLLSENGENVKI